MNTNDLVLKSTLNQKKTKNYRILKMKVCKEKNNQQIKQLYLSVMQKMLP